MHRHKYTLLYYIGLVALLLCISCNSETIYSYYHHVPLTGWERNDTVSYHISPVLQAGSYQEKIGIRIKGDYPFKGLTLIIHQTVFPSMQSHSDTLNCQLVSEQGYPEGKGVNLFQYDFPITTLSLNEGDSLRINIHHDMKREILPGVADIGLTLTRE